MYTVQLTEEQRQLLLTLIREGLINTQDVNEVVVLKELEQLVD